MKKQNKKQKLKKKVSFLKLFFLSTIQVIRVNLLSLSYSFTYQFLSVARPCLSPNTVIYYYYLIKCKHITSHWQLHFGEKILLLSADINKTTAIGGSGGRKRTPPLVQDFLFLMQFFGKIWSNTRSPSLEVGAPSGKSWICH